MRAFDFVDRASDAALARDQLSGSEYWVNDRVLVHAFGTALEPFAADLVTVALSCYSADRITKRSSDWSRQLRLRIALHHPDPWISARDALEAYLGILTDDAWTFEFVGGRRRRVSEQQGTLFPVDLEGAGSVALFSGGLDSLAGAALWLARGAAPLVLVGARSSRVIGRDQHAVASELRRLFGQRVIELGIPLELRNALSRESTQRTRGFLFLSFATAAALTAKAGEVVVFENGYGAHNPRLAENQFGSQATLATHPHLLTLFERLTNELGREIPVRLPHRWETKAQLLRQLSSEATPLVRLTSSCDSYPLRLAGRTHCGRCGSCVLRRQSLMSAGLRRADRDDYVRLPLDRGAEAGSATTLMARQAWQFGQLATIEAWDEIAWRWPSLTLGANESSWEHRAGVLGLMRTYAEEWSQLMTDRPYLRRQLRWPASVRQAIA